MSSHGLHGALERVALLPAELDVPRCDRGIGSVITDTASERLIAGVRLEPLAVWPDDRGHFLEVLRAGRGLAGDYAFDTTQVSATVTYPGVIKAFHYHLVQVDCWTVVSGMLQVALVDLRRDSPTFGHRNTLYVGDRRAWQVRIPPGVAHGYKVIGPDPGVLVYVTSHFYNPGDELRLPYDDARLAYDWNVQFK